MPVPPGTPNLTLGRMLFDRTKFRKDTDPEIINCLERMAMGRAGAGWDGAAKKGDPVYMAVYAQPDGGGAHLLWGGNPADPVNPFPLTVSASGSATVNWQEEGVLVVSAGTANFVGAGVTVTDVAGVATVTIPGGGGGGTVTEAFKTISVSGQSDIVADSATDTLTVVAGTGIVVTTNAGTDTMTFAINTSVVAQNSFTTIAVSGQSNVVADSPTDTLTLIAGTGIVITTSAAGDSVTFTATGDGVGYDEIQEEGTPLTNRAKLNFIGPGVTVTDDAGNGRTNVTVSSASLVIGLVTKTIAGASAMNGTAKTATAGRSVDADAVTLMTGDPSSLTALQEDLGAGDVDAVRRGANFSKTDFRGSTAEPILMWGMLETYDSGDGDEEHFIVVGPFDMRSFPSHDSTGEQGPYHAAGSNTFLLGKSSC